jgi:hypothetical protein
MYLPSPMLPLHAQFPMSDRSNIIIRVAMRKTKTCIDYRKLRISKITLYTLNRFSNVYEIQYEKYLQNIVLFLRLRVMYLLVTRLCYVKP